MYRRPALVDLAAFARLYRTVARARAVNAPAPWTDCPVMNAYDFRPRDGRSRPSTAVALKALRFMGYRRPAHFDTGVFIAQTVARIRAYFIVTEDVDYADYETLNLVVSFRNYAELKEGRKVKWKLNTKTLPVR